MRKRACFLLALLLGTAAVTTAAWSGQCSAEIVIAASGGRPLDAATQQSLLQRSEWLWIATWGLLLAGSAAWLVSLARHEPALLSVPLLLFVLAGLLQFLAV